ncbi:MAG: NAD+ synthase [Campylobacter sp.]|nr:NAD+ synthase [Campylobacter sp.]
MDYKNLEYKLVEFLEKSLKKTKQKNFIIGISGGLDSAVVSALCSKIKNAKTLGVIMSTKYSNSKNLDDATRHCDKFKIPFEIIQIQPFIDEFLKIQPNSTKLEIGNFTARIRMNLLFDYSAKNHGVVVGTSNLSERLLGYGTIYGDMACAFNPIGEIFKTEIFEFAKFLKIDNKIIKKAPSADLWNGQSDEKDLGYSYKNLDAVLSQIYDNKVNLDDLKTKFGENLVNFVTTRIKTNKFKLIQPKIAKIRKNLRTNNA